MKNVMLYRIAMMPFSIVTLSIIWTILLSFVSIRSFVITVQTAADIFFSVEAYELLAYSKAVPRPGRNRELALHLLMENKGNIQEAVLDLMRSDTLDWSQYPIIYNSIYTDTSSWTPEEISFFQDAIYKGEKDFHQVASDVGFTSLFR
ncbi:hypothetical protein WUBG_18166 [Wuchereria bancrofti]|uniref:ELM2 domain-containing protein n=1 Tax=Wuchereria bancrofti TaxID=6293 RepID=J9AAC5_WUCBA|nr:hypothetical protein WUBG_18166 [Wuchereria bancrofti]